jgi:hypothetical protein
MSQPVEVTKSGGHDGTASVGYAVVMGPKLPGQGPNNQGISLEKTGVQGPGGAESGAVAPVFASFSDWLDACPVDLDDATRERVRAVIGDGWPAII